MKDEGDPMKSIEHKMSMVTQNVIIGTVTGSMFAYNLRLLFTRIGAADLFWILFFFLGPILGYVSGKERQRMERLKNEKKKVEEDLQNIQVALKRSTKKYRLLVEQANDAIYLTTASGRFLLFNEATCNLSKYSKNRLKNMTVSQLQAEEGTTEKHRKSWLDNGIYRYQEIWKTKDGDHILLEINAKSIQVGEHQLILHVARDVIRQNDANEEEKVQDIRHLHEEKLLQMSTVNDSLCRRILGPATHTLKIIQYLLREYPQEAERLTDVLSQWGKAQKLLEWLPKKNERDLKTSPCRWSLNEILRQELKYAELVTDSKGFLKQASLAPNLPAIFGFGRDFSITFGAVFRALLTSDKNGDGNKFSILTRALDDQNLVEIQLEDASSFKESLCRIIDPFYHDDEYAGNGQIELEFLACQRLFESLGVKMGLGPVEGRGMVIHLRIPSIQEQEMEQSDTVSEEVKETLII